MEGFRFGGAVAIFSSVLPCAKLHHSRLQSAIGAVEVGGENAIARPDRDAEMAINTVQTCFVLRKMQNKSVGGDGNLFYSFPYRRRAISCRGIRSSAPSVARRFAEFR